jgi:hypothetical protein
LQRSVSNFGLAAFPKKTRDAFAKIAAAQRAISISLLASMVASASVWNGTS